MANNIHCHQILLKGNNRDICTTLKFSKVLSLDLCEKLHLSTPQIKQFCFISNNNVEVSPPLNAPSSLNIIPRRFSLMWGNNTKPQSIKSENINDEWEFEHCFSRGFRGLPCCIWLRKHWPYRDAITSLIYASLDDVVPTYMGLWVYTGLHANRKLLVFILKGHHRYIMSFWDEKNPKQNWTPLPQALRDLSYFGLLDIPTSFHLHAFTCLITNHNVSIFLYYHLSNNWIIAVDVDQWV